MAKIVFLNFPTHGCINPLLATASELVKRGEHIVYYCTEEFRNKIERTGAKFKPYKGNISEFRFRNFTLFKALKLNIEMAVDKLEYNLDRIRKENPDLIIHDSICTWGKYLASVLKLPAVNLMHSFPFTESSIPRTPEMLSFLTQVGLYKLKNNFRLNSPKIILKKKYGIELSISDVLINREALNIIYTSKLMSPKIHEAEKSYKFVGPSLFFKEEESEFPFNKLNGKKVVYVSLGTLNNRKNKFYECCISAFRNSKYLVIISTGFDINLNSFGRIPENIIIRHSVPQQKLLKQTDLFITHAGMNSINESIYYGVPMLLFPLQFEQKMIADRVEELGAGIVKHMKKITPKKLFDHSHQIISDKSYKEQVLKYQTSFKKEEEYSHLAAADYILEYLNKIIKGNFT